MTSNVVFPCVIFIPNPSLTASLAIARVRNPKIQAMNSRTDLSICPFGGLMKPHIPRIAAREKQIHQMMVVCRVMFFVSKLPMLIP